MAQHNLATRPRTQDGALAIAARSLMEHRTSDATLEQVVSQTALDHHHHGLFQYAAIRVGATTAGELLERLRGSVEATAVGESTAHAAADLYRRMRTLVGSEVGTPRESSPMPLGSVHFWRARDRDHDAKLRRLRSLVPSLTAEVAELHFARGLSPSDVGSVLGLDLSQVGQHCAQALRLVQQVVGKRPKNHDGTARGVLVEAFSLDPRLTPTPPRNIAPQLVQPGDVIAHRYEIDGLLGAGAFADVYRAHDRDVEGHVVALKMIRAEHHDDASAQRGQRELHLIASVFHPSVVQLKDHGWHRGHLWFVMPLYRGETLGQRLQRGALSREEARSIFTPLAQALATMHRAGVQHQDIKPDNIFLADLDPNDANAERTTGRVLPILLDLGVAAKDAEVILAGTPAYLAPEVAARFAGLPDPAPVGPKADVFSLALTLRDALDPDAAYDTPITSVDAFVAQRAVHAPALPRPRSLRDLRKPFQRWLSTSPDARPSAAELCEELAFLTLPQERTARRLATLRWALPTAVALLSLFGFIVFTLSQEAALQRTQAALARTDANRASQRADSIRADLTAQQARRKVLEENIARLHHDYSESRLTREQLASHLEDAHRQIAALEDRIAHSEQQARERNDQLKALNAERDRATLELMAAQQTLQTAERQLERARERNEQQRKEAEQQRQRIEQRLASMELALEQSREQIAKLRQRRSVISIAPN